MAAIVQRTYAVKIILLNGTERFPLLIDRRSQLPDSWAARYAVTDLRPKRLSVNTIRRSMAGIGLAYDWLYTRANPIDLNARIDSVALLSQLECFSLVAWLRRNWKPSKAQKLKKGITTQSYVDPNTHYERVVSVIAYVRWRAEGVISRMGNRDPAKPIAQAQLEMFDKNMRAGIRSAPRGHRKALPEHLHKVFLNAIDPGSAENPFAPANRYRNYVILLLYWELGIRRGEALNLKTSDLLLTGNEPQLTIVRRADDPADTRVDQPLVKTLERTLLLGPRLCLALRTWISSHRNDSDRYPGAKRSPYLFVSETGKPLALRSVNDIFKSLRDAIPELPPNLCTHVIRHTWNYRFSEAHRAARNRIGNDPNHPSYVSEAKETLQRNYVMGWKKNSKSGDDYTILETQQESAKHMLEMQAGSYESL